MPIQTKAPALVPDGKRKIEAWSFSRWNDYNKCARLAFYKHVLRLKEPGSAAMERGSAIGELAERFAQKGSKRKKCPAELAAFEAEFRDLQTRLVRSEEEWAFRKDWTPTGWFDDDAWCRVKVDCAYVDPGRKLMVVIDYKTGKERDYHLEQLDLYALAGFLKAEELGDDVTHVEVQLWYLDQGVQRPSEPKVYALADVPGLKRRWNTDTKKMLTDVRFPEKPGNACRWCHFRKANSGPCKY